MRRAGKGRNKEEDCLDFFFGEIQTYRRAASVYVGRGGCVADLRFRDSAGRNRRVASERSAYTKDLCPTRLARSETAGKRGVMM